MWGQPAPAVRQSEARLLLEKNASRIPQPHSIRRPMMKANVVGKSIGPFQHSAGLPCVGRILDDQFHSFVFCQVPDDLGIDPRNRLKLSWPVSLEMRPGQPCGCVRLPFSGHAITEHARFEIAGPGMFLLKLYGMPWP